MWRVVVNGLLFLSVQMINTTFLKQWTVLMILINGFTLAIMICLLFLRLHLVIFLSMFVVSLRTFICVCIFNLSQQCIIKLLYFNLLHDFHDFIFVIKLSATCTWLWLTNPLGMVHGGASYCSLQLITLWSKFNI